MKKTIRKIAVGGLTSFLLGSGLVFADDPKPVAKEVPKGGVLGKDLADKVKEELEKAGVQGEILEGIMEALKQSEGKGRSKVVTKSMVIGPDGKSHVIEEEDVEIPSIKKLFERLEDEDLDELLEGDEGAVVSGKVVVVDQDGNRTEMDLKNGQNLNDLLKEAMGGIELDLEFNDGQALGMGPAFLKGRAENAKDVRDKLNSLEKELKAQRVLLEKILEKLK